MSFLISASRRTDIPAFFGEWFRKRLEAGWCETRNPFSKQVCRVSLKREDVLGWVFWSRNYAPFFETLCDLRAAGQPFLCHFTVNGLPSLFEPRVPALELTIETAHSMAEAFGPDVVLWRYDPILLSSLTPPAWHRENFARLAKRLEGATRRCYFSFPTMYKKTVRNLEKTARLAVKDFPSLRARFAGAETSAPERTKGDPETNQDVPAAENCPDGGFRDFQPLKIWSRAEGDFSENDQRALLRDLAATAHRHGIEMRSCCGPQWVNRDAGILTASCADWPLLKKLGAGRRLPRAEEPSLLTEGDPFDVPLHPTRRECRCYKSTDIGAYQTCGHGCSYCYAVDDPSRARSNLLSHDSDAPALE